MDVLIMVILHWSCISGHIGNWPSLNGCAYDDDDGYIALVMYVWSHWTIGQGNLNVCVCVCVCAI